MTIFGQADAASNKGFVHDGHEIFPTKPLASSLACVYHFMDDAVNRSKYGCSIVFILEGEPLLSFERHSRHGKDRPKQSG